jgi:hypothetical protein
MALTLAEIRDFTRDYLDVDSSDISDALINRWVQEGFFKIVKYRNWTGYETDDTLPTVANTQTYARSLFFEGDIAQIYGPSGPLPRMSQPEAERAFQAGADTSTGEPIAYSFSENELWFWPIPNDAYTYTIRGIRTPTNPIAGGSALAPDLPNEELHSVLLDYVCAQASVQQDETTKASYFQQIFNEGLKQFAAADGTASPYQPVVINGRHNPTTLIPDHGRWGSGFPA